MSMCFDQSARGHHGDLGLGFNNVGYLVVNITVCLLAWFASRLAWLHLHDMVHYATARVCERAKESSCFAEVVVSGARNIPLISTLNEIWFHANVIACGTIRKYSGVVFGAKLQVGIVLTGVQHRNPCSTVMIEVCAPVSVSARPV